MRVHSLVLDGVFARSRPVPAPVLHALPAPIDAEVAVVLDQVSPHAERADETSSLPD